MKDFIRRKLTNVRTKIFENLFEKSKIEFEESEETVEFNNRIYLIKRKNRSRRIVVKLRPFQMPILSCAKMTSKSNLIHFLKHSNPWIEKQYAKWQSLPPPLARNGFPGETYLFLGKELKLKFNLTLIDKSFVAIDNEFVQIYLPQHKFASLDQIPKERTHPFWVNTRSLIQVYLERKAETIITERVCIWSKEMQSHPKELKYGRAKSRWGSCSSRGTIRINRRLIGSPIEVIDSVVIHELAHLTYMNHSKDFWQLVKKYCPEVDALDLWLNKNSHRLVLFE